MEYNIKRRAIDIINNYILTPVIYMFENDLQTEFICFCDINISSEEFAKAEEELCELIQKEVILMDLREYDEMDRMDIVREGELIYTAHPAFGHMFERSMTEDARAREIQRSELVKRYNSSGSVYLQ